jgi:hypothetical protein
MEVTYNIGILRKNEDFRQHSPWVFHPLSVFFNGLFLMAKDYNLMSVEVLEIQISKLNWKNYLNYDYLSFNKKVRNWFLEELFNIVC